MCEVSYVSTTKEYDHIIGGSSNTLPMPNPNPPHNNHTNHANNTPPVIQTPSVNSSRTNSMFLPTNHIVRRGSGHLPHDIGTPSAANRYVVNNNFPQYCNPTNTLNSFNDSRPSSSNTFDSNNYGLNNSNSNFNTQNSAPKWISHPNNNWNMSPSYGHNNSNNYSQHSQQQHIQQQHLQQQQFQQQYMSQIEVSKQVRSPSSNSSASTGSDNSMTQYSTPESSPYTSSKQPMIFWRSPVVNYPSSSSPANINASNKNGNRNN